MSKFSIASAAAAYMLLSGTAAFAGEGHGKTAAGEPGKATDVTTTIEVVMYDSYYEPETISVKEGETVRFVIRNAGEFVHEFNIGTAEMHASHQDEMMMMMQHGVLMPDHVDMAAAKKMQASMGHGMHNDPNSVLLEPGKSADITWTFPKHMESRIEFACNVPGHYQSGMTGRIRLTH